MQNNFSQDTLIQALSELGLKEGDTVLIHSDLRPFGFPDGCATRDQILDFFYRAFLQVLGPTGTLAVPAYFYEYARYGEPFDVEFSPVSKPLGVFSSFINSIPKRIRSLSPMQSLAAVGGAAQDLCGTNSLAGYGVTSPWHHLIQLKGKIVFLGTTIQPMTFVHQIEQQFAVPHLYTKIYPYPVLRRGIPIPGQVTSCVRYLEYKIEYDLLRFQNELDRLGFLRSSRVKQAPLYCVNADDAFQTGIFLLQHDPYVFLKQPPSFIPGKIPTDGTTGKKI